MHATSTKAAADFQELTDQLEEALEEGRVEEARDLVRQMAELAGADEPIVRLAEIRVRWTEHGARAVLRDLEALSAEFPDDADLHHLRGCAYDELGERKKMIAAFQETLRIDSADDEASEPFDPALLDAIEARARAVLDSLPAELARRLARVPVILESRPSEHLVAEGFDPRALGLFEGATMTDSDVSAPSRIVLYVQNLFENTADDDELLEEVEVTVLHEVGHYFGLDEDEVAELGLA